MGSTAMRGAKEGAKKLLRACGLDVRRAKRPESPAPVQEPRATLGGFLNHAKRLGLKPETIFDVGVAHGTPELYAAFPTACHVLIEPLEEYAPHIREATAALSTVHLITAAAGPEPGERVLHVHPDLVGSSFFLEDEDSDVNGVPRAVKVVTVDQTCADLHAAGPYLLKADVQGAELDVLSGSRQTLKATECVILEVCLFEFYRGGALLPDLVAFLDCEGFAVYDIFGPLYRPLDGAMSQVDVAFVKKNGALRKHHVYATRAQRAQQTAKLHAPGGPDARGNRDQA